jgi:hypothetical protein
MAKQSKEQKETVGRVMHEYKHGELKIRGSGPTVKIRKQAVAIALHEAGATNQESAKKNRQNLARTKGKERKGQTAEAEKEGKRAQDRTMNGATGRRSSSKSASARGSSNKTSARGSSKKTSARKGSTRAAAATSRTVPKRGAASQSKTKSQLYAEARRKDVPGRSKMSKGQLERALAR